MNCMMDPGTSAAVPPEVIVALKVMSTLSSYRTYSYATPQELPGHRFGELEESAAAVLLRYLKRQSTE